MKRILLAAIALLALGAGTADAQDIAAAKARIKAAQPADFPKDPLELVVVYPAGGGMDVAARILGKYMEKYTDQKVIVNNRVGAAGMVGHSWLVAQAKPDGYTMGVIANLFWSDAMLKSEGKFEYNSLEPFAFINYDPVTWIVTTDGALKDIDLKGLAALIKAKPNTIKVTMTPNNSLEFVAEQFENAAGGKFVKVPFQGGAPAITALLGNHVDVSFGFFAEYRGHLEAKKVKAIGVAASEPSPNLPGIPTFNQTLGVTNINWVAWRYVALPKGVPADRKRYLATVFDAVLNDPELKSEYAKSGAISERSRVGAPEAVAKEVDRLVAIERQFYVSSGRLKQ